VTLTFPDAQLSRARTSGFDKAASHLAANIVSEADS
jgi:hypothetical protein